MMYDVIHLSPSPMRRLTSRFERSARRHRSFADGKLVAARARIVAPIDRLPSWSWPLLVAIATWPSALWAARRLVDDSDDPLGIVAMGALMLALWHARARFVATPRAGLLAAAAALAVVSDLPLTFAPDLVRALMANVAIVTALAAIADRDEPIAAYAGLAILSLPLLSSLQFYAGFPLRVVTAEASRWLLTAAGSTVERVGSALMVDGHLVLVDAPCSGVRMAWVGYFTACATALAFRVGDRTFVGRLPAVGATVLVGNIVRNTLLVAADAHGVHMTDAMHAAVGLGVFVVVCGAIAWTFASARRPKQTAAQADEPAGWPVTAPAPPRRAPTMHRAAIVGVLFVATAIPMAGPAHSTSPAVAAVEWPTVYEGRPLRPLALSPVEMRFAAQFPGSIARFADGDRTIVMRDVERPTRRLHPAVDCYRGLGYSIRDERIERIESSAGDDVGSGPKLWRCFSAMHDGRGLRVCERIVDVDGNGFTDVSSWFWAATFAQSHGPWRAVTTATPLGGSS